MAQATDKDVANGTGAEVRSEINARIGALYTNHSGSTDTAMVTKYPYQTWADDSSSVQQLKLRNSANNAWIPLRGLNGTVISPSGTAALPGITFDGDLDTGIYRSEADTIAFSTNQSYRLLIGGSLSSSDGGPSLLWRTTVNPALTTTTTAGGVQFNQQGRINVGTNDVPCMNLNRIAGDGNILQFRQDATIEGSVSVSGTTVSFNGGHLSRWSQLPGNAVRIEILRGTVLANVNEMCEWGSEENEQLNRMKVSDVEGDVNVAGVFQAWDDDDETYTNDFYCAMTGDFVIRIAQNTTVARGDLLMSAGDGTAKPQDDDIVRSKTVAKVTSTVVSATYADGSYCVPCVLMAC